LELVSTVTFTPRAAAAFRCLRSRRGGTKYELVMAIDVRAERTRVSSVR